MGRMKQAHSAFCRSASKCMFLALLLFFNRASLERPDRPSFSTPPAPPPLRKSGKQVHWQLLHGGRATPRPLVARSAYITLQEETLSNLRPDDVAEEFFRHWSLDSLLVRALARSGASHLFPWKSEGNRQLSFGMKMNIPWHHVQRVESWSSHSKMPAETGDLLIRSAVTAAHGKDTLTVEITFEMDSPVISRLLPRLQLFIEPSEQHAIKVWIGGLVEWKEYCHFLIRRPMEHGFMLGLSRLARTLLDELRRLVPSRSLPCPPEAERRAERSTHDQLDWIESQSRL